MAVAGTRMKYLLFTNTPAHVHLYKHLTRKLETHGHTVQILARDYGCTTELLDWYDLPYSVYGYCDTTKSSLFTRLPQHYARILSRAHSFNPDLIFGIGSYAAHAGALTRTPTILVLDSEPTWIDHRLAKPFARAILTPVSFRKHLGSNHYVFDGFKECAYLHPTVFSPRSDVRSLLNLGDNEPFVLTRFNAFGSHHDVGKEGFSLPKRRQLVQRLAENATVFVSDEGGHLDLSSLPARRFDLHPARLHDALAEAKLLVADSQTMVTEAALLGTPAIRSNEFVGENDMGNFVDLAAANLIDNLRDFEAVVSRATEILETPDVEARWERRRDAFIEEKVNLTELLFDIATGEHSLDKIDGLETQSPDLSIASSQRGPV